MCTDSLYGVFHGKFRIHAGQEPHDAPGDCERRGAFDPTPASDQFRGQPERRAVRRNVESDKWMPRSVK
jgi:hypothetical protein